MLSRSDAAGCLCTAASSLFVRPKSAFAISALHNSAEPVAQREALSERGEVPVVAHPLRGAHEGVDGDPGQCAADADALRTARTFTGFDTDSHKARISSSVRRPGA